MLTCMSVLPAIYNTWVFLQILIRHLAVSDDASSSRLGYMKIQRS